MSLLKFKRDSKKMERNDCHDPFELLEDKYSIVQARSIGKGSYGRVLKAVDK